MSDGWENYEPSELEFFHGRLHEAFHEWRKSNTKGTSVEIDGIQFNKIVARAKLETYRKYSYLSSHGIPKVDFDKKCETVGKH